MQRKDVNNPIYNLPVYGAAADIARGAFLKRGATPATMNGALVGVSGDGAHPDLIGRLLEMLDYSEDGETVVAGTSFVTKPVELASHFKIFRIEYSLATADLIQCTQAVSTTSMTVTSLEDDIDAAFFYVDEGTGAGQTNYLTASTTGACTLKAAFGTSLDTTSYFAKILPRFHPFVELSTDGTKLRSGANVPSQPAIVIDSYIMRNNRIEQLNPTKHAALTGLNSLRSIRFFADVAFRDTIPASID
jgi:hypothetical protein